METLEYLLSTSMSHPQAPSVPKSPGPPPTPDPNTLTNAEAEHYVSTSTCIIHTAPQYTASYICIDPTIGLP